MKTYVIYTTTKDQWEICGGIYLLSASSETDAMGRWAEEIYRFNPLFKETIDKVEEFTGQILLLQEPISE